MLILKTSMTIDSVVCRSKIIIFGACFNAMHPHLFTHVFLARKVLKVLKAAKLGDAGRPSPERVRPQAPQACYSITSKCLAAEHGKMASSVQSKQNTHFLCQLPTTSSSTKRQLQRKSLEVQML